MAFLHLAISWAFMLSYDKEANMNKALKDIIKYLGFKEQGDDKISVMILNNKALEYAAAMNVSLVYYKLIDDVNDEKSFKSNRY